MMVILVSISLIMVVKHCTCIVSTTKLFMVVVEYSSGSTSNPVKCTLRKAFCKGTLLVVMLLVGMYIEYGTATLTSTTFASNSAFYGGGLNTYRKCI